MIPPEDFWKAHHVVCVWVGEHDDVYRSIKKWKCLSEVFERAPVWSAVDEHARTIWECHKSTVSLSYVEELCMRLAVYAIRKLSSYKNESDADNADEESVECMTHVS